MPTIRATCSRLRGRRADDRPTSVCGCAWRTTPGSYLFRCPACNMAVVKPAEPRIVDLLVASGVELSTWQLPGELYEPRVGAPLNHDDLLDFHHLLEADDWFDQLGQPGTRRPVALPG